jgi:hypothetical protein
MSDFISLYDYLGYAAGSKLGKQVADYAASQKVPHRIRYVSNPKYSGEIMLYPSEFLEEYFTREEKIDFTEINTQLIEDAFEVTEQENENKIF